MYIYIIIYIYVYMYLSVYMSEYIKDYQGLFQSICECMYELSIIFVCMACVLLPLTSQSIDSLDVPTLLRSAP